MSEFTTNQRIIVAGAAVPESEYTTEALDENAIADHLETFLQAEDNKAGCIVFSALFGGIHVYVFPPSEILARKHYTLVTMGISGTKMKVPNDISDPDLWSRCELMCYLPADWQLPGVLGGLIDEWSWPIEMIRAIGEYVSRTASWIADMHGLPSMLRPPGYPVVQGSKITNCIVLEPTNERDGFERVALPSGETVNLYLVVPLSSAEAQWKREVGAENSIFHFVGSKEEGRDSVAVDYVISTFRPCAVDDLGIRVALEAFGEVGKDSEDEEGDSSK